MNLAKLEIDDLGGSPVATHNQCCAVCLERHAVLRMGSGIMMPCWSCRAEGWRLVRFPRWLRRLFP